VPLDMESIPGRKHPAQMRPVERHNEPIIVFLTVCSQDRKRIFDCADCAESIVRAWGEAKSWLVGRYVLMPDHIHLFCAPGVFPYEALKQWVRYWKNLASRKWGVRVSIQFSNVISGIRSCVDTKLTTRSGNMCCRILFALAW
jgi:hypothetical protein